MSSHSSPARRTGFVVLTLGCLLSLVSGVYLSSLNPNVAYKMLRIFGELPAPTNECPRPCFYYSVCMDLSARGFNGSDCHTPCIWNSSCPHHYSCEDYICQ